MRFLRTLVTASALVGASWSATSAVPIQPGQMVSFEVRGEKVAAYTVRPAKADFYPAVVVIHEWWGINDQIKGVADRLAENGYRAIVPDLYRGKVATDPNLAHELMRGLNENWAVDVVAGAVDWVRAKDAEETRRRKGDRVAVATLGFCMGGRISLATALKGKDIQAAVMYYGSVETDKEALQGLKVPLLGIFGNEDNGIPVDQIKAFEAALKDLGKDASIRIYPGVGHAFFNETRPSYDKESAEDSWAQTQTFLKEKLAAQAARPASKPKPQEENR